MNAPRVLLSGVVLGQPQGGVRRHNQELLPRLSALLTEAGGGLAILEGRVPLAFPLPPQIERYPSEVPARPPLLRALHEARALERCIQQERARARPFDLVHLAHYPVPRQLSLPYTVTIHDLRALELAHTPFSRRFFARTVLAKAFERAALVFTVSETMRQQLIERFRLPETKIELVPNAGDHLPILQRRKGMQPFLLHVGHLEPRKNIEVLLAALAQDPGLPPLHLAGAAKGDYARHLQRVSADLGLLERVRQLGPVSDSDLAELYASASAVVLPSRLEGFGIVVLEAQCARAPLAIAEEAALCEVAGPSTPRFASTDAAACARAIRAALAFQPAQLDAAALQAERYRWQHSAQRWFAAWNRLALRPPSRKTP